MGNPLYACGVTSPRIHRLRCRWTRQGRHNMSEGMFPNHPRSGFYFSAKGGMIAPYEAATMESTSESNGRNQADTTSPVWSGFIEDTGTTTGSGLYSSDMENH